MSAGSTTPEPKPTAIPHPRLRPGQSCIVQTVDISTGTTAVVYRTDDILLEAPNWIDTDTMILNGEGILWSLAITERRTRPLEIDGLPELNNDHVPAPERDAIYVSGYDWHIYRVELPDGPAVRVTQDDPARPMCRFLHGVSPDGNELAFVGIEPTGASPWGRASIFTTSVAGGPLRQLTFDHRPADGPEFSPDGAWVYFNTEAFTSEPGHAQIARVRTDGSELTRLTDDDRVNWFPHIAPDGRHACYLSYRPGTTGHPGNLDVELRLVEDHQWTDPVTIVRLFGGQGTINVNSWAPDSSAFAFVSYPIDATSS